MIGASEIVQDDSLPDDARRRAKALPPQPVAEEHEIVCRADRHRR